jgi:hypothetical protein
MRKQKYEQELKELIDLLSEGLKRIDLECNIKERI